MPDPIDSLIDDIYEAAVLPQQWPDVLGKLAQQVSGVGGVLFAVNTMKGGSWAASHTLVDVMRSVEAFNLENTRPQRALAQRYSGFMSDMEFMTAAEKKEDPLFVQILQPNGLAWACGSVVPIPNGDLLVLDFERTEKVGPFDRYALDVLDSYRPHLARAGMLASRLQSERLQAAAAVLQAMGLPGIAIDSKGHALAMNELAEKLSPQVSTGRFNRLSLANKSSNDLFHRALSEVHATNGGIRSIPVPAREDKPALVAHLIPIAKQANDLFSSAAALFVATPLMSSALPDVGLLCGLFDLTPAEDRVARVIFRGGGIGSTATHLSLSPETVRSHLKQIMAKTGTTRQSELVRLLIGTTSLPLR